MNTYYIYEIANKINGKTYIGQRKCPKKKTPWTDVEYMGSGKLVKFAEKKYGFENFNKEIIAVCYSKNELDVLEKEYIALYRSIGKAEYNITDGGNGGNTFEGRRHTEETKQLMSLHNGSKNRTFTPEERYAMGSRWRGKHHTEEQKRQISESCKGINRGPKSEETKWKISETLKGNIPWNKGMKMDEEFCKRHAEIKRKMFEGSKGDIIKQKLREANIGFYYWNNGEIEIHSKECPGKGFTRGRLGGSNAKHWYTNGFSDIFVEKCPKDFWYGRTFPDTKPSYWNNGVRTVYAVNSPGEGFVKGNLNCSKNVKGSFRWTDGKVNVCSKECPGEGFFRGISRK